MKTLKKCNFVKSTRNSCATAFLHLFKQQTWVVRRVLLQKTGKLTLKGFILFLAAKQKWVFCYFWIWVFLNKSCFRYFQSYINVVILLFKQILKVKCQDKWADSRAWWKDGWTCGWMGLMGGQMGLGGQMGEMQTCFKVLKCKIQKCWTKSNST